MTTKTKNTKRKVGRPTLASMGLPPRVRRNFNMERDDSFDSCLTRVRHIMAQQDGVDVEAIDQAKAVRYAVYMVANQLPVKLPSDHQCPQCNGRGILYILRGDDDVPCPECATQSDTSVSF